MIEIIIRLMVKRLRKEKAVRMDIPQKYKIKRKAEWSWGNLFPKGIMEILAIVAGIILLMFGAIKLAVAIGVVMVGWMGVMGRVRGKK